MERFFNTAGPNIPEDNYTIDPLSRFDYNGRTIVVWGM